MENEKYLNCLVSIMDTLKLHDTGNLYEDDETLSEMMFRKMRAYDIDLAGETGLKYLRPITRDDLDFKYLDSLNYQKNDIVIDSDNVITHYTLPNGLELTTPFICNGAYCTGTYLSGLDEKILITTKNELTILAGKKLEEILTEYDD